MKHLQSTIHAIVNQDENHLQGKRLNDVFTYVWLQNSDLTQETSVAHLVPQPWEFTGVLGIIGHPTQFSEGCRPPLTVSYLPAHTFP